jgi:hypothetical protein
MAGNLTSAGATANAQVGFGKALLPKLIDMAIAYTFALQ